MNQEEQIPYSVLMSVYQKDHPEWLDVAMESMLRQTYPPFEFVLVEDGPLTEDLYRVIENKQRNYPGIIHRIPLEQNRGLGLALRCGMEKCHSEWIARMDSDDYARPDRMEKQMKVAMKQSVDIVGSDIYEFQGEISNRTALRAFPETSEELAQFARRKTPFAHPSVLLKRSSVLAAGNYTDAYLHEDYDLFLRMLVNGCRGYTVKEPLVFMRVNDDFYMRRGGLKYLCKLLSFNYKVYKKHWIGTDDFLVRSCGNIVVCLLPNRLRVWFYKHYLRRTV